MDDWKEWLQEHWKIGLAGAGMVLIVVGTLIFWCRPAMPLPDAADKELVEALQTSDSAHHGEKEKLEQSAQTYYIDIKGAVKKPGMYQVQGDMRVFDAIELAGGFAEDADREQVNLAMKLTDQMVLLIPKIGETLQENQAVGNFAGNPESTGEQEEGKINLNTADVSELQQLNGIGQKKAEAIIDYREQNGSFQTIEEITKVSGIGQQTFEKLKEHLIV